jgi:hypothetical protein
MSYCLHKALLGIAADFKYAFDNHDLGLAIRTIEGDLATAYVVAKELEDHGYEAFKEMVENYDNGDDVNVRFNMEEAA